jgi:pimeloyl-ACP methyl ester carboxylesterase
VHRYYRDDVSGRGTGVVASPATVIHGAQDGCISPAVFAGLDDRFAGGVTTHLLPDVGHWPHLESPAVVNHLVMAALSA